MATHKCCDPYTRDLSVNDDTQELCPGYHREGEWVFVQEARAFARRFT